jgi:DNA-binding NtrC family response regulator
MTPIKILINVLDDEQIWRDLISEQLSIGYNVISFSNSQDFFSAFNSSVDLVIMDVRLKDGTDVIERIQRIYDVSPNCYIIIVSAYLDVPLLRQLIRLRVSDTVEKSSTWLEYLGTAVEGLSGRLRSRAEMKEALNGN